MFKGLVRRISSRYAARAAKHGDLKTAERLWVAAIAYGDNSPATHQKLGELYLQLGNYERAGALLSVAASSASSDASLIAKLARACQESGELDKAETHWLRVRELDPSAAPQILCCLGEVKAMQGELDQAIAYFERALKAAPDFGPALAGLELAMQKKGRLPEAGGTPALDQTVKEAVALHRQGKLVDAARLYEAVLQIDNGNFDALHLLGTLRTQQGRYDEAAGLLIDAVRQNPGSAEAHSNLGNALHEARRHEEAIASYGKAIALKPDFAEAHNNLGNALNTVERHEEAIASCRRALAIKADLAEAHYNIGIALYALERHEEAVASHRSALSIKPDDVEAHNNLGLALNDLNRQREAIAFYQRALALKPDFAEAHWNRGLALLTIGDYKNGWDDYEWRWRAKVAAPMQDFPRPLWLGATDLRGKTVLLHADQGFGDTIQFVRYVPMVAARGARVVLQVRSRLKELMTNLVGVDLVVSRDDPLPAFDCHCPLSSLPRAFGTSLENIPAEIPYLRASADRVAKWEALLAGHVRPRIGLTWSGDQNNRKLRHRFIALARLLPLLSAPGVCFVSLQKDVPDEDARMLDGLPEITHLGREQDNFADTAAAVSLLDLVISVDTSIVHLAGALGKPVWVLLPFKQDWRWLLEREDSPWYPSARLFRQPRMGDWDSVVERVRTELLRFSPQRVMR